MRHLIAAALILAATPALADGTFDMVATSGSRQVAQFRMVGKRLL